MYGRSNKRLLMLALSCAAIILGIYMTFFYREAETAEGRADSQKMVQETDSVGDVSEEAQENLISQDKYDYSDMELPTEENESENEIYNGGKLTTDIYFSNTALLDEGGMPLEAQKILCSEVQKYLRHSGYEDVTELYIDDESYQEDAETISFVCFMDGHEEMLQIEYHFAEQTLKYYIVELDKYGAGGAYE